MRQLSASSAAVVRGGQSPSRLVTVQVDARGATLFGIGIRAPIFLMGGGWTAQHRDAVWGPFLDAAFARSGGVVPSIACIVIGEGSGPDKVARWATVLEQTAACRPVPIVVPVGTTPNVESFRTALATADGLLVCGGLTPAYAHVLAPVADLIRSRVADAVPYSGFSAGAAVAADRAVVGGWMNNGASVCPAYAAEDLDAIAIVPGLGLTPFAVGVHAAQWGTMGRLVAAVSSGLVRCGVAIDEDTVLAVSANRTSTVFGVGRVHLVRPSTLEGAGVLIRGFQAGEAFVPG